MTPAARLQAAIDLLDLIIAAARDDGPAADTLIARYFRDRRYAGSKDRRAVRDLVYRAIRAYGDRPESGRTALVGIAREDGELAALFDGSTHGPAPILPGEGASARSLLPRWIVPELAELISTQEQAALLDRAPLHIRVNPLKTTRQIVLARWPGAQPIAETRQGVALPSGTDVESDQLARDGALEIQDAGSQIIAQVCAAGPGMTVLDLCAGGGGKTLALAADMAGEGRLIAADTVRDRLARLVPRAERAGCAGLIETLLLDPGRESERLAPLDSQCDVVLIDAPCSGSGTWRRNPEARWRLTPDRLARIAALQARLLQVAAPLVKPGGRLVYAVCSLIDREGHDQVQQFVSSNFLWSPQRSTEAGRPWGLGTLLSPQHDGTDGFFFSVLEKPC
ncbi:RsmB/NOP family class I SAM-dependent RNA methyltransferase [Sphingobium nicotianae]|uniref:RsmB/NOP family class I SAM-dependent RNA methyltransferase n=1 Tax=Sphingobium nicotianae TaxID=2782607 RepID=A0A9X1DG90_9SPHN|nr:RsmB/NOP family class I SAM-dependent RNA methyltransferase [Sphingobium nicotianae]MBT2189336.1 RsmB/NOP family class I SAM-dependent RNA methyltransferase [Sphingobium nicotianae]